MTFACFKCGEAIEIIAAANRVGLRETCPRCDADLHACRNCRFYDTGKHNQCAEPQAEWVRDKEAANYCDYFSPNPAVPRISNSKFQNQDTRGERAPSRAEDAKKRFDSLFKN